MFDWFRNEEWNDEIESVFFEKLRRARDKAQYLRIQAWYLASNRPDIALRLLDQYFSLNKIGIDLAQAYVQQATAYKAQGKIDLAIESYEKALSREDEFPNSLTQAYLELPKLILENNFIGRYKQALEILDKRKSQPAFPIERFRLHSISALIFNELGERVLAKNQAAQALDAANRTHSGMAKHSKLGLVDKKEERATLDKLKQILAVDRL